MFCTRCGTEVADEAKFCPSCGLDLSSTTPMAAVEAQEQESEIDVVRDALKDEYEVIKELGRGGMAIVYRAREKTLDREVALKVLPFSLAFDAEFVERFQREARTAAKLEHPHIIPIYRVGKSGRVIYFVMKFLRGQVLSDIIEQQGALPPAEIKKLLTQTMGALGYAHKNGVVHRDIKPDNIMYDESGNAIVTDFGIAKAASGTRLTGTG
ncbi:MAG: protein kinase, partial [Gemmatimonadales bacterium]